ncbi:hypothetical protein GCM10022271_26140 [Corallibacter vietnamensis]|uniref:SprT-like domain-containing protein n=1 Tax=Corallibacter vietnamensis TaxID=904130 RepID=A0ABP7HEV8_9FLAO
MKKLKNYLKLGFILYGISLLIISCQKNDDIITTEQHLEKTSLQIKIIKNKEIFSNNKLFSKLHEFSTIKNTENSQNKTVYNAVYDFYIDTDIANYIETDANHSYTFPIYRNTSSNLIENLLLSLQEDGTYKAYLIAYHFSEEQKNQVNNLQNIVGDYDLDIIELDDDFSEDIFGKMIYEDGYCVTRTVYHTNPDGTWVYTGSCPWEAIGNYEYCSSYTIDSSFPCPNSPGSGNPDNTNSTNTNPNGTDNTTHGNNNTTSNNTTPTINPEKEDCLLPVVKDSSFKNSDLDCIYKILRGDCLVLIENQSFFRKMLNGFNVVDAPLKFSVGNTNGVDYAITSGETIDFQGNSSTFYEIKSDSTLMANSSNLTKMVTLSHELIHAYMFQSLEELNIIEFNAMGEPEIPNISSLCNSFSIVPNVNLNTYTVKQRWVYLICEFNHNNPGNQQWTHSLFNTANFDVETYREKLEQLLLNEHDWDGETDVFKNEAISAFGATDWKQKVAEAASWQGLELTDGYNDYINTFSSNITQLLYINAFDNKLQTAKNECN